MWIGVNTSLFIFTIFTILSSHLISSLFSFLVYLVPILHFQSKAIELCAENTMCFALFLHRNLSHLLHCGNIHSIEGSITNSLTTFKHNYILFYFYSHIPLVLQPPIYSRSTSPFTSKLLSYLRNSIIFNHFYSIRLLHYLQRCTLFEYS